MSEFTFDYKMLIAACKRIFEEGVREGVLAASGVQHMSKEEVVEQVLGNTLREPGYLIHLLIETGLKQS